MSEEPKVGNRQESKLEEQRISYDRKSYPVEVGGALVLGGRPFGPSEGFFFIFFLGGAVGTLAACRFAPRGAFCWPTGTALITLSLIHI
mgnify:CR=1 FL=1